MNDAQFSLSKDIPQPARLVQLRDGRKRAVSDYRRTGAARTDFLQLGQNVGIVLDDMYLAIDIDRPDAEAARFLAKRLAEHPTWQQKTGHGRHYLYTIPDGWHGTNVKLKDGTQANYGDLKALGYIVAPGSIVTCDKPCDCGDLAYTIENALAPAPAPEWLLELAVRPPDLEPGEERAGVPYGEHDNFLIAAAGFLRGRYGLTESTLREVLPGLLPALEGQDDAHPYRAEDFARIARSAAHYAPPAVLDDAGALLPANYLAGEDFFGPWQSSIDWVLRGFVARGCFTTMYGEGGIGKTSWAAWLVAGETARGNRVGIVLNEDTPNRFGVQVARYGGNYELLTRPARPQTIRLPNSVGQIEEYISSARLTLLYFDSLYDHFTFKEGENMSERARRALSPLAEVAQRTGCAIVGNLHQNKAGTYLGSVEVRNISRTMLTFQAAKDGTLYVDVDKTNYQNPRTTKRYRFDSAPLVHPVTGEAATEDGAPATVGVLIDQGDQEAAVTGESVNVDLVAGAGEKRHAKRRETLLATVQDLL
jgi:hypothetical protein